MVWDPTHVQLFVIRAKGLLTKGKNGTNDAFVVMSMGKEKFQTSIKDRSGPDVEWSEECELAIPDQGNTAEVNVTVYHRSMLGIDEFLGTVSLPLKNFDVYERAKAKWYPLEFKNDKKQGYRGEIEITLGFTVKSGSLTDLSKKEKHKGSLGQLSAKAQNLGHKIGKLPGRSTSMRGDKRAESGYFERRGSIRSVQSSSFGDGEQAISEDEEEFRFDDLSHKSSSSSLNQTAQAFTPVQGSLENLAGGEFLSRNFSGPRSGTLPANLNLAGKPAVPTDSGPMKPPRITPTVTSPDEWEKKLFGRNVRAAERPAADVPVESSVPSIVVQQQPVVSPTEELDPDAYHFTRKNASRRGRKKPEETIDEKNVRSAVVAPMPRNPEPEKQPEPERPLKGMDMFEQTHEHVAKSDSLEVTFTQALDSVESPLWTNSDEESFVTTRSWATPLKPASLSRNIFAASPSIEPFVVDLVDNPGAYEFETIQEDVDENLESSIADTKMNLVSFDDTFDSNLEIIRSNDAVPALNEKLSSSIKSHILGGSEQELGVSFSSGSVPSPSIEEEFPSPEPRPVSPLPHKYEVLDDLQETILNSTYEIDRLSSPSPKVRNFGESDPQDREMSSPKDKEILHDVAQESTKLQELTPVDDANSNLPFNSPESEKGNSNLTFLSPENLAPSPPLRNAGVLDDLPESTVDDSGYQGPSNPTSSEVSPVRVDNGTLIPFFTPVNTSDRIDFFTPQSELSPELKQIHDLSPILDESVDSRDFIDMPIVGLSPRPFDSSFQFTGAPDTAIVEDRSFSDIEHAVDTPGSSIESRAMIRVHESHRRTLEGIEGLGSFQATDTPEIFRFAADTKRRLTANDSIFNQTSMSLPSTGEEASEPIEGTPVMNGRPETSNHIIMEGIESPPEKLSPKISASLKEELGPKSKEELILLICKMREHMRDKDEYISAILLRCMEHCPRVLESPLIRK